MAYNLGAALAGLPYLNRNTNTFMGQGGVSPISGGGQGIAPIPGWNSGGQGIAPISGGGQGIAPIPGWNSGGQGIAPITGGNFRGTPGTVLK